MLVRRALGEAKSEIGCYVIPLFRNLIRRLLSTRAAGRWGWWLDRLAAGRALVRLSADGSLVVAAPGRGNIGDRAMLDAVLENLDGKVTVVADVDRLEELGAPLPDGVRVVVLPGLTRGLGLQRFRSHRAFASLCRSAARVTVIGADMMDGLYSVRASVARFSLLLTAQRVGTECRVLGFSWPSSPARAVEHLPRLLSPEIDFCLRDPRSLERFRRMSGGYGRQVADVVFSSTRSSRLPEPISGWVATRSRYFAVVNVSGLVGARLSQTPEYQTLLAALHERGWDIVFLPHVVRGGDGDLEAVAEVFEVAGRDTDLVVTQELSPAHVRTLAASAALVVTGRMHLAILSATVGVPSITLATQGKVEGLYELLGLPSLAVAPEVGFGQIVATIIRKLDIEEAGRTLRTRIPHVMELSAGNFDDRPRRSF